MSEENTVEFGNIEATHDGKLNNLEFVLRDLRMAFTQNGKNMFDAETFKGVEAHNGMFIIQEEDQMNDMEAMIKALVDEHLNGVMPKNPDYICLKIGDDQVATKGDNAGEVYDGFEGNLAIKWKNKTANHAAPQVYSSAHELIEKFPDKRVFRDGCICDVQFRLYAYSTSDGDTGVSAECQAVIMVDEGTPFTAARVADTGKLLGGRKPSGDSGAAVFGRRRKKD